MMEDYSGYPDDPEELKKRLFEAENNVTKLAEIGKDLLEQNTELKKQLDELRSSADRKLEEAEQAKYELQNKYDQKVSVEAWLQEEVHCLRQQLQDAQDTRKDAVEADRAKEVAAFTKQIAELKADLEQSHTNKSQLEEKVSELELLLEESMKPPESPSNCSFSKNEELCQLYEEQEHLHSEITALKAQLIEKKSEVQTLTTEHEKICSRLTDRDEELEDIRCQLNSVNNSLEEARMEKLDLKAQLDSLRMETSHHNKKGNSIFSELDDRRVDAEKKLISLQLKVKSLQEKFDVEKQQNQKYKRQISQLLLEASSGRVDDEYVDSLERKLASARQELKMMIEKQQLDEKSSVNYSSVRHEVPDNSESQVDKDYQQYLITLLKQREDEKTAAVNELRLKKIQLLDEKSRSALLESQLKTMESDKQKLHSKNIKLSLRVEELQLKYEPDAIKKSGVLTVKRIEKISVDNPQDVKIKESRRISNIMDNESISTSQLSNETEQVFNVTDRESNAGASVNLLDLLKKKKSVRISEEVEEHEIDNHESTMELENRDPTNEMDSSSIQKGRRITEIKHFKRDHENKNVDGCKSQ